MKIEDLIGRKFHTKIDKNKVDIYKIEGINAFGKVILSLNNGNQFEYLIPKRCLDAIENGTWVLVEEERKHPSLKQIEELYKNAQSITCAKTDVRYDIHYHLLITETNRGFYNHNESMFCLYDKKTKVFASYTPCEEASNESVNITQTPFYLDEYIHNNDAEKRIEAEKPNTRKISELPQQFTTKDFDFNQAYSGILREGEAWFKNVENLAGPWSVLNSDTTFAKKIIESFEKLPLQSDKEVNFDIEIQSTIQKIQQLLLVKGKEYRRNNNPYHNFEVAARKKGITPERALDGFLLKHLVSYDDMLNDIEQGVLPKIEVVEEKFNDIICYMVIQKAQILNRIKNEKN